MPDNLRKAIAAIKSGDKNTGKQLLIQILKADSNNEQAWLWMTKVVNSDEKRIRCFKKVLEINPNNEIAKRGIAQLQQKRGGTTKRPSKSKSNKKNR